MPLDGLCLEFFRDFYDFFLGGSVGQIIYREYIVFRGSNISCSLACGSAGVSSGNSQETEACMVRECHMPWQPPRNHPSGDFWGWATPWSAEEMLDGLHQRVDIQAHARIAHKGLLQKRPKKDLCWIVLHVPDNPIDQGTELNWTELTVQNAIQPHDAGSPPPPTSHPQVHRYITCPTTIVMPISVPVW